MPNLKKVHPKRVEDSEGGERGKEHSIVSRRITGMLSKTRCTPWTMKVLAEQTRTRDAQRICNTRVQGQLVECIKSASEFVEVKMLDHLLCDDRWIRLMPPLTPTCLYSCDCPPPRPSPPSRFGSRCRPSFTTAAVLKKYRVDFFSRYR